MVNVAGEDIGANQVVAASSSDCDAVAAIRGCALEGKEAAKGIEGGEATDGASDVDAIHAVATGNITQRNDAAYLNRC